MIFNNFGQALRVSVGPYLLLVLATVLIFGSASSFEQLGDLASGNLPPEQLVTAGGSIVIGTLVLLILFVFVAAWVAVSWHRFILLEEYSGIIPAISGRPIWPYIGRSFVYGLFIGLVALILGFAVGIVTAIVSTLTGIPVHKHVAMTGEVTLRGRVLPIGGLKEKLLAALRGGIETVLIPAENEKDLVDIPENITSELKIIPVKHVDEVLAEALADKVEPIEWSDEDELASHATAPVSDEPGSKAHH